MANPADLTEIDPPNFKFKESDLTVTVRSLKNTTRARRAKVPRAGSLHTYSPTPPLPCLS